MIGSFMGSSICINNRCIRMVRRSGLIETRIIMDIIDVFREKSHRKKVLIS